MEENTKYFLNRPKPFLGEREMEIPINHVPWTRWRNEGKCLPHRHRVNIQELVQMVGQIIFYCVHINDG